MDANFDELKWYKEALQSQLKPCPFCGSKDIAIHVPNKGGNEDITCLKCGAKVEKALGVGVVLSWNLRT
jgi:Lar family restriction alleviation protein